MPQEKLKMPAMRALASFRAATFNEETRTVDVLVATPAPVLRYDFELGYFNEVLDFNESSVRMERINAGAPIVDTHRTSSLENVLGVVERAWLDGEAMYATVRFSQREDVKGIMADVRDGILRNISVGYSIFKLAELRGAEGDEFPTYSVVDWEPFEVSLVPVPADTAAGVRSGAKDDTIKNECVIEGVGNAKQKKETPIMDKMNEQTGEARAAEMQSVVKPEIDVSKVSADAVSAERSRVASIREICRKAGVDNDVQNELIDGGVSVEQARSKVLDALVEKQSASVSNTHSNGVASVSGERSMEMAEQALDYKMGRTRTIDNDNQFMGMSLFEIAREFAKKSDIYRTIDKSSRMDVARAALHSTSDFPKILANIANKRLRSRYESSPRTWEPITNIVSASDFKTINPVQLGEAPKLLLVSEGGEFQYGTIGESGETYVLGTYGRIVAVTRQMLINDDLRAFDRVIDGFADQAANLVSDLVWAQVTSNPNMADGNAVFSVAHKNTGSGALSASDFTSLSTLRTAMRKQTGIDGQTILNLAPTTLIVPAALETVGEQIVNSTTMPNAANQVNPFKALNLIVEPRLDATSAAEFYVAADKNRIDMVELAFLDGRQEPYIESAIDFDTDGVKLKVRLDVAAKIIDFRGLAKSSGS